MKTINISLPDELKKQVDALVTEGHYASFSDLARNSFRQTLRDHKLDRMVAEAKRDHASGKTIVLKTDKDIDDYFAKFNVK